VPPGAQAVPCPPPIERVVDNDFIAERISPERTHLWLVGGVKTGSTWLTSLLSHLLGWQTNHLVNGYHRREQEVDLRPLLMYPDRNLFSIQQHCRFSEPTREFINKFRVRVVLQGRNLLDSLVSLRDHLRTKETATPLLFFDEALGDLPAERLTDMVVHFATPWYLNFYVSWLTARQRGEVDFLWVDYESLLADPPATLRRILDYLGQPRTPSQIEAAIRQAAAGPTRLNVGRTGRGQSALSEQNKAHVRYLRSFYPHVDLSAIGL